MNSYNKISAFICDDSSIHKKLYFLQKSIFMTVQNLIGLRNDVIIGLKDVKLIKLWTWSDHHYLSIYLFIYSFSWLIGFEHFFNYLYFIDRRFLARLQDEILILKIHYFFIELFFCYFQYIPKQGMVLSFHYYI